MNVRKAIEDHLLDNSSAVRDAAVELIGKYVVQRPELAGDYYERIADRIVVRFSEREDCSILNLCRTQG